MIKKELHHTELKVLRNGDFSFCKMKNSIGEIYYVVGVDGCGNFICLEYCLDDSCLESIYTGLDHIDKSALKPILTPKEILGDRAVYCSDRKKISHVRRLLKFDSDTAYFNESFVSSIGESVDPMRLGIIYRDFCKECDVKPVDSELDKLEAEYKKLGETIEMMKAKA